MIREKFKTFLLVGLFAISIFLTQQLWIQFPYKLLPTFGQEMKVSNEKLSDIIVPEKYLINFNERNHTMIYSDNEHNLWSKGKKILRDVFVNENIVLTEVSTEELVTGRKKKSVDFYFPETIPTFIFAKMLDTNVNKSVNESISSINEIYMNLDNENYVIFSDGDKHIKVTGMNTNPKDMASTIESIDEKKEYTYYFSTTETLRSNKDVYIPLKMRDNIPNTYVKNEIDIDDKEGIDNIAEQFFDRELDYIKKIVENDNSVIYIYNQKTLKIYENGLIEYFNSLAEPVIKKDINISLNTAIEFISTHMGWPKEAYLSKIEEVQSESNNGYKFIFEYKVKGLPLIQDKDNIQNSIEIEVFNEYIKAYRRFIREDVEVSNESSLPKRNMLSAYEVLDKNFDYIQQDYIENKNIDINNVDLDKLKEEIKSSINDVSLAYFDPIEENEYEELIGVWVIYVDDFTYTFDIYDGELINGGNLR